MRNALLPQVTALGISLAKRTGYFAMYSWGAAVLNIGLNLVLPAPLTLAAERAELVALIKPQFEVGRAQVGKGGVVRDPAMHREVCERAAAWVAAQPGWSVVGIVESPILGPDGNREFLLYACRSGEDAR